MFAGIEPSHMHDGSSAARPSGIGDLKSQQIKTPASVSGSSTGTAITERPLVVHSGMKRATKGFKSRAEGPRAPLIGSREKLSLRTVTMAFAKSSVATSYRKPPSSMSVCL